MDPKRLKNSILIFTDGASSGNPGPGGWAAIVVFPDGKVQELGGRSSRATNNEMELKAVVEAIEFIRESLQSAYLYSDSTYVLRGVTQWIHAWRRRGWKTAEGKDVQNQVLWERLGDSLRVVNSVHWKYVPGHKGYPGNERADEIATQMVKGKRPELYSGPLLKYPVAIHDLPPDQELPPMKDRGKGEKKAAFSYLSLLDGQVIRHANWKSCEARVKGRSGAKFKKAETAEDESRILAAWKMSSAAIQDES